MADAADRIPSPPLVALAGWVVPGLGYYLVGEKRRAYVCGITIIATFLLGLLIGGVRVVDVPGYDLHGDRRMDNQAWRLQSNFVGEVLNKPWYIAQTLVGPLNVAATWGSIAVARGDHPPSTARIFDIGTLYTSVAGMLNLLALIDSAYRASREVSGGHA